MIIVGYQGIGKSTIAEGNDHYVDLESSCFWYKGKRISNWYVYYCKIAEDLSMQGYVVFVSSHAEVRNRLKKYCDEPVYAIVPSEDLKDEWIKKLHERWQETKTQKDYKAYANAEDRFIENIREIKKEFGFIEIQEMDYNLKAIIEQHKLI